MTLFGNNFASGINIKVRSWRVDCTCCYVTGVLMKREETQASRKNTVRMEVKTGTLTL